MACTGASTGGKNKGTCQGAIGRLHAKGHPWTPTPTPEHYNVLGKETVTIWECTKLHKHSELRAQQAEDQKAHSEAG